MSWRSTAIAITRSHPALTSPHLIPSSNPYPHEFEGPSLRSRGTSSYGLSSTDDVAMGIRQVTKR